MSKEERAFEFNIYIYIHIFSYDNFEWYRLLNCGHFGFYYIFYINILLTKLLVNNIFDEGKVRNTFKTNNRLFELGLSSFKI